MKHQTILIKYIENGDGEVVASGHRSTDDVDSTLNMLLQTYINVSKDAGISMDEFKQDLRLAMAVYGIEGDSVENNN